MFRSHGHNEIDTARIYGQGIAERYLGDLDWQKRGLKTGTKLAPTKGRQTGTEGWSSSAADIRGGLMVSLQALKTETIDLFYLHAPDRSTPFEETLEEVDKLHKEGLFARFGISYFLAGKSPTVYQGVYRVFHRQVEDELIPCLRKFGLSLYVFNSLAGGFLTGQYTRDQTGFEDAGRFKRSRWQSQRLRNRYWHGQFFDALDLLRPMAKKHNLTEAECGLRWLRQHSMLSGASSDAINVGASNIRHVEENLQFLDEALLPEEILQGIDLGWECIRGVPMRYHD